MEQTELNFTNPCESCQGLPSECVPCGCPEVDNTPVEVKLARERRPKWMIEQEREDRAIRRERRKRKRAERDARRKVRQERKARREGLDEIRAEVEVMLKTLSPVNLADYRYCESCHEFKHWATMGDVICIACEDKLTEDSL